MLLEKQIEELVPGADSIHHQVEPTIQHIFHFRESLLHYILDLVVFQGVVLNYSVVFIFFVPLLYHGVFIVRFHVLIFRLRIVVLVFFGLRF